MPTSTNYPPTLAKSIAKLLEADPIASGQVKEHISRERLLELLGIEPLDETLAEFIHRNEIPEYEVRDYLFGSNDQAIKYLVTKFTKSEILEAISA